jgi:hypothetical protein
MADKPTHPTSAEKVIPVSDAPHAPIIFYEGAPVAGTANGIINLTLAAGRTWVGPDGIVSDHVVVAYLRGNIQAALSLRNALNSALLAALPTAESKAN